jgi:hypothetical protein
MREHIAALRAFFKAHHDIRDGSDGPRPNWAMQCSDDLDEMEARINDALKERGDE